MSMSWEFIAGAAVGGMWSVVWGAAVNFLTRKRRAAKLVQEISEVLREESK
jgi:hypothetical protein